ncbi:MAG: hypothetical protein ABEJ76_06555 [Halanaeroarchaeum sp.]
MSDDTDDGERGDDGATADDETARGADRPEELDTRERDDDEAQGDEELPPEAREDDDYYEDKYDEAREVANPDQHRDDEPYD